MGRKRRDLTGKTFGKLTAICETGYKIYNKTEWKFKCECGSVIETAGALVTYGQITSCGCSKRNSKNRTTFGVGYNSFEPKNQKARNAFKNMMERCYSEEFIYRRPSYVNAIVNDKWHDYKIFEIWFENNYIEGWQLDKDLLSNSGIYSENNCIFLPSYMNNFFINCDINNLSKRTIKRMEVKINRFIIENEELINNNVKYRVIIDKIKRILS